MTEADFAAIIKAFGVPGSLIALFFYIAVKTNLFKLDDPSRNDVLDEIRGMRKDTESEFRSLRDRITKVETILDERKK